MSRAVDVLAVMDELLDFEERHAEAEPRQNHEAREARAAVAELIEAAKCVDSAADHASFVSDECCCGSRMDAHDMGSGHAPVDSGEYYGGQALTRLHAALARVQGGAL